MDLTDTYAPPPVPGTGPTFFHYNRDRQLTRIQRPDGVNVEFAFDAGGRLKSVTTPRGATTYAYAPTGVIDTIGSPDGVTLTYTFDGPLPTSERWSGPVEGRIDRVFDGNFWMRSEQVAGTAAVPYYYDDDGRVIIAGDQYVNLAWDTGLPTETNLRRVHEVPSFDTYGELTHDRFSDVLTDTTLFEVDDRRDDLGRITQRVEEIDGVPRVFGYFYDDAGRLERVTRNGDLEEAYTYDLNGNRLTAEGVRGSFAGTYDDQDRLLTYGAARYTYTANGALAAKTTPAGVTTYSYDALGNLTRVALPDGRVITYLVDGRNRRVAKRVDGVRVRAWLYADQLRPIAELDGAGNVVSRFIYASRSNVPDYFIRDGLWYKIITDHLGSPRIVLDAWTLETPTPTVAQRLDYDPFGIVTQDSAPGWQPFGFAGGLYDPDTKLVRFGARDYDPEIGRWTSKDPIGFDGGSSSLFAYSANDPLNLLDPDGRIVPLLVVGAAVGAAIGGVVYAATAGDSFSGRGLAGAMLGGAVAGAVGTVAIPVAAGLGLGTGALGATLVNAGAGLLAGAMSAGLDPCQAATARYLGTSALFGAFGGLAGSRMFPTTGMSVFSQVGFPRTWSGVLPEILGGNAGPNMNAIYAAGTVSATVSTAGPATAQMVGRQ